MFCWRKGKKTRGDLFVAHFTILQKSGGATRGMRCSDEEDVFITSIKHPYVAPAVEHQTSMWTVNWLDYQNNEAITIGDMRPMSLPCILAGWCYYDSVE